MADAPPAPRPSAWERWLLPGDLHEQPTGKRSPRDWIVDLLSWGVALGLGTFVLAVTWTQHSAPGKVADLVLGAIALGLLWVRRRWPIGVATAIALMSCVSGLAAGAALIAGFSAVLRAPVRRLIVFLLPATLLSISVLPAVYPTEDSYAFELVFGLLFTAFVLAWGAFVRARRDLVLSLRERTHRAEAEQALRLERARATERRRIAREMHDVLAHRLSLLSLHAGALEYHADADPEEVERAAAVIRTTAHQALEELREVIGVLREGDDPPPTEPPQPTLDRLAELVAECRAAGMRVDLALELGDAPVSDSIGRTAYRIVQEGLTNARKHAPGAAVAVDVRAVPGPFLSVTVRSRPPIGVVAGPPPPGAGTGLVGLRERVELADGVLEHGPDAGGDFVVRATLPWTPA